MSECAVCQVENEGVRDGLVHWRSHRPTWEFVPRCADRAACADRCREQGIAWPLIERDVNKPPIEDHGKVDVDVAAAAKRKREYADWAARQDPTTLDRRPPQVDSVTGAVAWPAPVPVPAIPTIAPTPPGPGAPGPRPRPTPPPEPPRPPSDLPIEEWW